MKRFLLSFPCVLLFLSSGQAGAFPGFGQPLPAAPEFAAELGAYNFEGIVALSNCSGSLVRFDDSRDSDKALVLSNGHCVKMIDPGLVIQNQAAVRSFDVLNASASKLGTVSSTKLVFATMTKTDVSLYQLKETYQDIEDKFQIQALTLSREAPVIDSSIEVLSGYWKRGYSCSVEAIAPILKEGNWSFQDSVRYSRPGCEVIGGTSGSPVLQAGSRTVIAVNNTVNESGKKCAVNNPCEVDKDGIITANKGVGYAQEVFWFYSCRNQAGVLDLNLPGCLLPKPAVKNLITNHE
ncbi:MAG: trypsin-like peptidase domain-containing protein [Proteobacteria bacterium]|nr:trypsin-like peptidase domain-containing protein [Pseudomonadota bacterium]